MGDEGSAEASTPHGLTECHSVLSTGPDARERVGTGGPALLALQHGPEATSLTSTLGEGEDEEFLLLCLLLTCPAGLEPCGESQSS